MGAPRLLMWWPTDLNDSHAFPRLCLHALRDALARSTGKPRFLEAEVWFNHGAWAEWTRSLLALQTHHAYVLRARPPMRRREHCHSAAGGYCHVRLTLPPAAGLSARRTAPCGSKRASNPPRLSYCSGLNGTGQAGPAYIFWSRPPPLTRKSKHCGPCVTRGPADYGSGADRMRVVDCGGPSYRVVIPDGHRTRMCLGGLESG